MKLKLLITFFTILILLSGCSNTRGIIVKDTKGIAVENVLFKTSNAYDSTKGKTFTYEELSKKDGSIAFDSLYKNGYFESGVLIKSGFYSRNILPEDTNIREYEVPILSFIKYTKTNNILMIPEKTPLYTLTIKLIEVKSKKPISNLKLTITYADISNETKIITNDFISNSKGEITIDSPAVDGSLPMKLGIKLIGIKNENKFPVILDKVFDQEIDSSIFPISFTQEVSLEDKENFLKPEFLADTSYEGLRKNIKLFLDDIILTGNLKNLSLPYNSIDIIDFKDKKYLKFNFSSTLEYNNIRLNKYDVAKSIYGESVVKLLDYLILLDDNKIAGINVKATALTKSFTENYDFPEKIVYDFIMEKETIKAFKNKDITSQKLLDESIILMDNERIELKLQ